MRTRLRAVLAAARPADLESPEAIDAFVRAGCRGAAPTRYGGATTCIEVENAAGGRIVFDMGTGLRGFAAKAAREGQSDFTFVMTHVHWDHVQGFPFFGPAYAPGTRIRVHSAHDPARIEAALRGQHAAPTFPVPWQALGAEVSFHRIDPEGETEIEGFTLAPFRLRHPGDSYGYRLRCAGATSVLATDAEHRPEEIGPDNPFVGWARDADLLLFDAQYSLSEAISLKLDWGHSSNMIGIELARLAGARRLVLTHHEPLNDDRALDRILDDSRRFEQLTRDRRTLLVDAAHDGMEITL